MRHLPKVNLIPLVKLSLNVPPDAVLQPSPRHHLVILIKIRQQ